jgi:O-antigen/teichoic acid export membrane protein
LLSKSISLSEKATFSLGKFLKNTVALTMARGIDMAVMVIIGGVVARYLGPQLYGEYAFIITLVIFLFSFTYFGTERILIREIAKNKEKADVAMGAALMVRWIISAAVISIILVSVFALHLRWELKIAVFVTVVSQIALSSSTLYGAAYQAFERMEYEAVLTFFSRLITLFCLLLVVKSNSGFVFIFVALAIGNIVGMLASIMVTTKRFVKPRITFDFSLMKDLLKRSFILGINMLIIQALFRVDIFLLKAYKDNVEVSLFYAPHAFLLQMQIIPVAFAAALLPLLSRSFQGNDSGASYGYEKAFKLFWIVGIYVTVLGIICGPRIIELIYGPAFIRSTVSLQILMIAVVFFALHPIMGSFLISQNKELFLLPGSAIALLSNVGVACILIPRYGNIGASIASVFGYVVLFGITLSIVLKNLASIRLKNIVPKPLGALILMVLSVLFFKQQGIFFLIFISSVVYVASLILFKTFSKDEVDIVNRTLKRIIASS